MAAEVAGGLPAALAAIWGSSLPRHDRRYLCREAVQLSLAGPGVVGPVPGAKPGGDCGLILQTFEHLMCSVSELAGHPVGLGRLRRLLMMQQRPDLVGRLTALNKVRRAAAHPDVALAEEVIGVLSSMSSLELYDEGVGPCTSSSSDDAPSRHLQGDCRTALCSAAQHGAEHYVLFSADSSDLEDGLPSDAVGDEGNDWEQLAAKAGAAVPFMQIEPDHEVDYDEEAARGGPSPEHGNSGQLSSPPPVRKL
jgi:hypothetical protein